MWVDTFKKPGDGPSGNEIETGGMTNEQKIMTSKTRTNACDDVKVYI